MEEAPRVLQVQGDASIEQHRPALRVEEGGCRHHGARDLDHVDVLDPRIGGDQSGADAGAEPDDQRAARLRAREERQQADRDLRAAVAEASAVGLAVDDEDALDAVVAHRDHPVGVLLVEQQLVAFLEEACERLIVGRRGEPEGVDVRPARHELAVPATGRDRHEE